MSDAAQPLRLHLTRQDDGTHAGTMTIGDGLTAIVYDVKDWKRNDDGSVTARVSDRFWQAMERVGEVAGTG